MQLQIELTKTLNFAGWEMGFYNPKYSVGHSVLIGDHEGNKLKVIYDRPPAKYLFIVDNDYKVVHVQVNVQELPYPTFKLRVSIAKITKLHTPSIQGHGVPKAELETIWSLQQTYTRASDVSLLLDYNHHVEGYRDSYKDLMQAAIAKALAGREKQKLFWGEPRRTTEFA